MSSIDIYASDDTYICNYYCNENYSKSTCLLVGNNIDKNIEKGVKAALLYFDLSSLDKSQNIDKAELYLHLNSEYSINEDMNFYLEIYRVLDCYDQSKVVWKTAPNIEDTNHGIKITNGDINNYIKIDITTILRRWANNIYPNFGIMIASKCSKSILSIDSSRSNNRPFVHVEINNSSLSTCVSGEKVTCSNIDEPCKCNLILKKCKFDGISQLDKGSSTGCCSFAQLNKIPGDIFLGNCNLIPLKNVFILGDDINHVNGSTSIILAPHHSYFVSWNISVVTLGSDKEYSRFKDKNYEIGGVLLLNGIEVPGSEICTSSNSDGLAVIISNSTILNSYDTCNTLQFRYHTRQGVADKIKYVSLLIIEVK